MKGEKWLSALASALLAFCVAFGGCGCLVSGFEMNVSMTTVILCCGICAIVLSVCFALRQWVAALCALALAAGYLWQSQKAVRGMEALFNCLSRTYNTAYGWGVVAWSGNALTSADLTAGVCLIGGLTAAVICLVVCCRGRAFWGLLTALIPLGACLVVTDTVPGTQYLFPLLLGSVLLLLTQTTRRKSAVQGNRLLGLLTLPAALAVAALFAAVPQDGYVARSQEEEIQILQTWAEELKNVPEQLENGLTAVFSSDSALDQVDLSRIGPQSQSHRQVMTVTAAQKGTLYLRGQAFDIYDGQSWAVSPGEWGGDDPEYWGINNPEIGEITITTRGIQDVIYLPYNPGSLEVYGGMVRGRVENTERTMSYSVIQTETDIDITNAGASLDMADLSRYLALPETTRQGAYDYFRQNQMQLHPADTSQGQLAQARAIVELVKRSAVYDLNTQRMPQDAQDFAMWFLEKSETGYCVHFATAATVLLRAAGFPARYVTGYMVTGIAGQPVAVRGENAHAWVEIFLEDVGWIMLEPTPAAEEQTPTESQNRQEESSAQQPTAAGTYPEDSPIPSQAVGTGYAALGNTGKTDDEKTEREDYGWIWGILRFMTWAAGLAAVILGQWQLRLYLRRQKQHRGNHNAQALARWQEAVYLSRRLEKKPDEALFELAQKAKYSQHTISREELARFDAYLTDAQKQLRGKPLLSQVIDRLIFAAY